MVDWVTVMFSALWIVGLGLVIAALSYSNYLAPQRNQRLWQALKMPVCRIMINLGLVFFCLGLAGAGSAVWERSLWVLLACIFSFQVWQARKNCL